MAFARTESGPRRGGKYNLPYTDIYDVKADGSGLRRVTQVGDAVNPVWSPDAQLIVFSRERFYVSVAQQKEGLTASMWTIHPDGTGLQQLTQPVDGQDDQPGAFSPDGRLLAFTRTEATRAVGTLPNTSSVYLMDFPGGTARKLAGKAGSLAFSPDGRWIALSSTRGRHGIRQVEEDQEAYASDLYLVDVEGRRWRRLTKTYDVSEGYPSFSPDGRRIAYQIVDDAQTRRSSDSYHQAIYEINLDGSCRARIRDDRTDLYWYIAPAWRPGLSPVGSGRLHCLSAHTSR